MRKNVLIGAVIVVFVIVLYKILDPHHDEKMWPNNNVSASFPKDSISEPVAECPNVAEIFIDASGSMKPYFRASDPSLINTLSEIKNLNVNGTKIYFIGNKKPFTGLISNIIGEINKQPNLEATTFHGFFKESACRIDSVNELIYLVTDGIMSLDSDNMAKNLVQLRGLITNSLKGHPDLAAAIFRYEGGYKGDYWTSLNKRLTSAECPMLKEEIMRPYYVIALGRKGAIRWLQSLPLAKLNNPESLYLGIHDMEWHKKAILAYGDSAFTKMDQTVTLTLELPPCLKGINADSVKVFNNGRDLKIPVTKEGSKLIAKITDSIPLIQQPDSRIKISFIAKNEIPSEWKSTWHTDVDSAGPDQTTTYGFKYLIDGMFDALEGSGNILEADFIYIRKY